jgi:hypothetical protein
MKLAEKAGRILSLPLLDEKRAAILSTKVDGSTHYERPRRQQTVPRFKHPAQKGLKDRAGGWHEYGILDRRSCAKKQAGALL